MTVVPAINYVILFIMKTLRTIIATTALMFAFSVMPALAAADIDITKSAGVDTAGGCEFVLFTITLTNSGDTTAENVVVTDTLDGRFVFSAETGTDIFSTRTILANGQTKLTWDVGDLAAGEDEVLAYSVVTPILSSDTVINNTVSVSADNHVNVSASDSVEVTATPLNAVCRETTGGGVTPPAGGTGAGLPNTGMSALFLLIPALIPAVVGVRAWRNSRNS